MKNVKSKLISAALLIMLLCCGALTIFSGCTEPEIPWWKDYDNLEYVLEDDRSAEKSFTFRDSYSEKIYFNYTLKEGEYIPGREHEFIPKVKILHKGVEQKFYTEIYSRDAFPYSSPGMEPESVDYKKPTSVSVVNDWGAYRVYLKFYLNIEHVDWHGHDEIEYMDYIGAEEIYITVHREEKKDEKR